LKHTIKEVEKLEKEQAKAVKEEHSAHHDYQKATKVEHKTAEKLNSVTASESS
jgi:hypothetical protein